MELLAPIPLPPHWEETTGWIGGWVGPREGLEILEKSLYPLSEFELRILQPVAQLANTAGMGNV